MKGMGNKLVYWGGGWRRGKKVQMQGTKERDREAYSSYAGTTSDEGNAADGPFSPVSV